MNVLLVPSDAWWVAIAYAAVWKSVVVLTCAGMLVLALKRSAAARHLVWSLALAGTLVLPFFTAALPSWSWRVLPSAAVTTVPEINGAEDAGETITPGGIAFDGPREQGGSDGGTDDAIRPDDALSTHSRWAADVAATAVPAVTKTRSWPLRTWVLGVWLAGAA